MNKIDVVVPYVDSCDEEWLALYNEYAPKVVTEGVNGNNRFRGQGEFFRYFFRCLEANMPWINNVFLLVQSYSQAPKWINTSEVKIITHNQFIPKQFLPTFNSCTIEMFLWNIPGLSEQFIYFNDDTFITNYVDDSAFFSNRTPLFNYSFGNVSGMYGNHIKNSYARIFGKKDFPIKFEHVMRPYLKSKMMDCYYENKNWIDRSISRFRSDNNFNCYLYSNYLIKNSLQKSSSLTYQFLTTKTKCFNDIFSRDCTCINDIIGEDNIYENKELIEIMNSNLGFASKYEIEYDSTFINNPIINSRKHVKTIDNDFEYVDSELNSWMRIFSN